MINKETTTCVYIDAESSCFAPLQDKTLYRFTYDTSDWSSNRIDKENNQFCLSNPVVIAENVIRLLQQPPVKYKY